MVHEAGLEPARSFDQRILSPLRLPIPPLVPMEPPEGLEPPTQCLQGTCATNCAMTALKMRLISLII